MFRDHHSLSTKLVSVVQHNDQHGSSVPPIYQSTTFKVGSLEDGASQEYDYTRSGNPTRTVVQHQLAKLYGVDGSQALAVSSGMTALDMILRSLVLNNNGSGVPTIIAGDDLYGGTQRLLTHLASRNHARILHTDTTNYEEFVKLFQRQSRVACVLLESPTNPLLKVADLPRLTKFIKAENPECVVAIDNTMMSGLLCNPLQFQCDVVYESATKYLNGHHDIMAGVIIARTAKIAEDIYFIINSTGCGLSPLDSWLLVRGLKTLGVRMYQQQHNAMVLGHWLENSCGFRKRAPGDLTLTRYVGLESHPQFELHKSFNGGPGAVLSFETGSFEHSRRLVSSPKLKIWSVTVSFGCVNSLISMPCKMSHAAIDPAVRAQREFPEDLIRLCCGIESIADLQADLLEAMVDADIIELRDEGKTICNKLNGNEAPNTLGQGELPNIYEEFFGQNGIKRHLLATSRAKL
ncbi:LADA_0G03708g1_1 [Lachancea dasiensis]|uniref:cysteine-S-conjugate beta-lyase n=1 Tax=Lachancea dasiensis TaxID=1072105 RepID=A0A1G4JRU7_9SACH|nr:LADA_0G03708g1_1 [Lachancea dasiensis]